MSTEDRTALIYTAVVQASERWKSAFNEGDAEGCANQYEEHATMEARPLGSFVGKDAIQQFWTKLIADGFSDVVYLNTSIQVIDETSAILSSQWRMNKAQGMIHKELWVIQDDGTAKLKEDIFEVEK